MYHASTYKLKIVTTAFNKQMKTLLVTSESEDVNLSPSNHQYGFAALFCLM